MKKETIKEVVLEMLVNEAVFDSYARDQRELEPRQKELTDKIVNRLADINALNIEIERPDTLNKLIKACDVLREERHVALSFTTITGTGFSNTFAFKDTERESAEAFDVILEELVQEFEKL